MFKWLFPPKTGKTEKQKPQKVNLSLNKRVEQNITREEMWGEIKERLEYLFEHRTDPEGNKYTFDQIEIATANQISARHPTVAWLNEVVNGTPDQNLKFFPIYPTSKFFGMPNTFDFWYGDFTEDHKSLIRVTDALEKNKWKKIFDTESVILHSEDFTEAEALECHESLTRFINSDQFKSTLVKNMELWPENSFLILGLKLDKSFQIYEEYDLMQEPFSFSPDEMRELKYLLKKGWDFEWVSRPQNSLPEIYFSVGVPETISCQQVREGGSFFVQNAFGIEANLQWVAEHFQSRLDCILGNRIPDPSITAHHGDIVALLCGREGRAITVGDLRKTNDKKQTED